MTSARDQIAEAIHDALGPFNARDGAVDAALDALAVRPRTLHEFAGDPTPPARWPAGADPARWLRGACSSGDPLHAAVTAVLAELTGHRDDTAAIDGAVVDFERQYVQALNAVLASGCRTRDEHEAGDSADEHRWRGHAEAYRTVLEKLRRALGLPAVAYTSAEWRAAHGVYTEAQLAGFRKVGRR